MNVTINNKSVKPSVAEVGESISTDEKDFLDSMYNAMRKVHSWGRKDAQAGKALSRDLIYCKMQERFDGSDPVVAQALAQALSNCYAEGVSEVTA